METTGADISQGAGDVALGVAAALGGVPALCAVSAEHPVTARARTARTENRGRMRDGLSLRGGASRVASVNTFYPDDGRTVPIWEDLGYVDDETNARRRTVFGSHCHPGGPEVTEEIAAAIREIFEPGMTLGGGARHYPYQREPHGRAWISADLGEPLVDYKIRTTEDGPLLHSWRHYAGGRVLDVFIPAV